MYALKKKEGEEEEEEEEVLFDYVVELYIEKWYYDMGNEQ
jgi:hypothetical protein